MNLNLSCADFSFPLLSHGAALQVIALLGLRGADIGLFAGRSHLRPETELRKPAKNGAVLHRRLAAQGLIAADVFLQVHENFTDFAVNHPDAARRKFARDQFLRTLDLAAAAGSNHITILPGVRFKNESCARSFSRAAEELAWRVERAATMKLTVAVEPHLGSVVDTPGRALQLAAAAPGLGITLDYAHFTRAGISDAASNRSPREPRIFTRGAPKKAGCKPASRTTRLISAARWRRCIVSIFAAGWRSNMFGLTGSIATKWTCSPKPFSCATI